MSDETTTPDTAESIDRIERENPGGVGPNMNIVVTNDGFIRLYMSEMLSSSAYAMNALAARALSEELAKAAERADEVANEFEELVGEVTEESDDDSPQLELVN